MLEDIEISSGKREVVYEKHYSDPSMYTPIQIMSAICSMALMCSSARRVSVFVNARGIINLRMCGQRAAYFQHRWKYRTREFISTNKPNEAQVTQSDKDKPGWRIQLQGCYSYFTYDWSLSFCWESQTFFSNPSSTLQVQWKGLFYEFIATPAWTVRNKAPNSTRMYWLNYPIWQQVTPMILPHVISRDVTLAWI